MTASHLGMARKDSLDVKVTGSVSPEDVAFEDQVVKFVNKENVAEMVGTAYGGDQANVPVQNEIRKYTNEIKLGMMKCDFTFTR